MFRTVQFIRIPHYALEYNAMCYDTVRYSHFNGQHFVPREVIFRASPFWLICRFPTCWVFKGHTFEVLELNDARFWSNSRLKFDIECKICHNFHVSWSSRQHVAKSITAVYTQFYLLLTTVDRHRNYTIRLLILDSFEYSMVLIIKMKIPYKY